ncbi:MAG: hypothetical protein JWQ77_3494, partial [Jatrophihabitans sp.]|nr:hypothetical protein [Jatrophihabitans sp.]
FIGLILLPADFSYPLFAALLALNGIGTGLVAAPNTAAIMNAVPASQRGAASGVRATGMNAGMVLSMGGFFTLMAIGLASKLPASFSAALKGAGVDPATASRVAHVPPVGELFAAFLGDNPVKQLLPNPGPGVDTAKIYGKTFFPRLLSDPFTHGLLIAFGASVIMLLIAAGASLMRGERFVHDDSADQRESLGEVLAREGAALSVPAAPGEDVAFDDAMAGRPPSP